MKVLVSADMEGATGVTWPADVEPGTEGVLAHTYRPNSITSGWVNGVRASEGYLNAQVAAEYGVPVPARTFADIRAGAKAATYG